MRASVGKTTFIISLSVVLALVLAILPLPSWAIWFRPQWVVLVVIYWCLMLPDYFGVGFAWLCGLFLDLLVGTLVGEHALALVLVAYVVMKFHHRIRALDIFQQMLVVFFLTALYKAVMLWIQGVLGQLPETWMYLISLFTTTVFWPWVFVILKGCQKRFAIYESQT